MPRQVASKPFNAFEWIGEREPSLQRMLGPSAQALLHFALMWNIFEGHLCSSSASISKLEEVANLLANRNLTKHPAAIEFLRFIQNRYWSNNTQTHNFAGLRLRSKRESIAVSAVVSGVENSSERVIFAQLLVIYRYRNNTFHGIKEIADVLGGFELFDAAARFLGAALEVAN